MRIIRIAAIVVVLMLSTVAARSTSLQEAAPTIGTAVLSGSVVTDETSPRPLRRATVWARAEGATLGGMAAVTDDDGRFAITGAPAGRYRLTAYKAAYVPKVFGSTRPGFQASAAGTIISAADGQRISDLVIRMTRGSVLTGVVREAEGKPARSVRVEAFSLVRGATGEKELSSVQGGDPSGAVTDARGVYRLFGLPPGNYLIAATPGSIPGSLEPTTAADLVRAAALLRTVNPAPPAGSNATPSMRRPTLGFSPVYFPGTSLVASASIVTVGPGEERGGLDFAVSPVTNAIITGTLRTPEGQPATGYTARLFGAGASSGAQIGMARSSGQTDGTGAFTIAGVAPGDYVMEVSDQRAGPARQGPAMSALVPITIANGDARVDLTLSVSRTITGRVVFEAASLTPPQNLSSLYVALNPRIGPAFIGRTPRAEIATDGQITMAGVANMRYMLAASIFPPPSRAQSPWYVKSATLNGQDVLDRGIDVQPNLDLADLVITFTDHPTEISGRMTNAQGQPAPEYFIIVFPTDQTQWTWQNHHIQQTRPTRDGAFAVRGLPAGEYLIGAVADVGTNDWFEPEFLRALVSGAIKVTLAEGEKKTQNISVK